MTIDETLTSLIARASEGVARCLTVRGAKTAQVAAYRAVPCDLTYRMAERSIERRVLQPVPVYIPRSPAGSDG